MKSSFLQCFTRDNIRRQYIINDNLCNDCLILLCFSYCVLMQKDKKMKKKKNLTSNKQKYTTRSTRCTPSKPYNISTTRSASSQAILAEDASKDDKMEFVNERQKRPSTSRTTVIYERQSWEGEFVGERDVRQGRGRPRKQYLVQW